MAKKKNRKTRDLTELLIKRIRNYHIAEGVSLQELRAVSIIVKEYFNVLFDFLTEGKSVKVGENPNYLLIDIMSRNIEDVDLKRDKPMILKDRIDRMMVIKCHGLYLERKYSTMDLTISARNKLLGVINYKNLKHI